MLANRYRYLIPNSITFLSLFCGIFSIFCSATGRLLWAGLLILSSYVLDNFDGILARRLNASTAFGLQLDSLVDMVSLGAAPAVLLFTHLQQSGLTGIWLWPIISLLPMAGAFRLARFNLLPIKTGAQDSLGLTISTGGVTVALAVTANVYSKGNFISPLAFLTIIIVISLLMVSKIRFPPLPWVFSSRLSTLAVVGLGLWLSINYSVIHSWFWLTGGYVTASLARASYFRWLPNL